jgi:hypothetical protein
VLIQSLGVRVLAAPAACSADCWPPCTAQRYITVRIVLDAAFVPFTAALSLC